jgi:hypothetical protein
MALIRVSEVCHFTHLPLPLSDHGMGKETCRTKRARESRIRHFFFQKEKSRQSIPLPAFPLMLPEDKRIS